MLELLLLSCPIIGLLIFLYLKFKHKKLVRVEWDKVTSFLTFMVFVTFVKLCIFDIWASVDPTFNPYFITSEIPIWTFLLVGWEDMFFVMPIYYLQKRKGKIRTTLIVMMSLFFGIGHAYQGLLAVAITSLYPYFISLQYGKKYGFGTVMLCHMMFDFITFYMIYLLPLLLPSLN